MKKYMKIIICVVFALLLFTAMVVPADATSIEASPAEASLPYEPVEDSTESIFNIFYIILIFAYIIIFAMLSPVLIVLYVIESIAISAIIQKRGSTTPSWVAWIPFARGYTRGKIADEIKGESKYKYLVLCSELALALITATIILDMRYGFVVANDLEFYFTGIYAILLISAYISELFAVYYIFLRYTPTKAKLYTIICAIPLTAFLRQVFLFRIRKEK
ncbi:MAG: hypothetical protein FWD38_08100 [Oscillospiraceae bacterium]|nr:hypothetical protein [Oscillospiraceae bacterium]